MRNKTIFIILLAILLAGCRKEMPDMQNPRTDDNINNWSQWFESYWTGMNYNYVFWDIDPTDWDEVYREYQPRFQQLAEHGFEDSNINQNAFEMVMELSSSLIDRHFGINAFVGKDEFSFSPGSVQIMERENYHTGNDTWEGKLNSIVKMYNDGRLTHAKMGNMVEEDGSTITAALGIIDQDIIYFTFNQFTLSAHLTYDEEDVISVILNQYLDFLDSYPDVEGVIIDVRGNGGGAVSDMYPVLGKFVQDDNHIFCYQHFKNGVGRLDFSPWVPGTIKSMECARTLDIPIVVVADMNSVSMAEMTTLAVLSLPNGVFVGERTYGGNGTLISDNIGFEEYYCGYFKNNAMEAYTTSTAMIDLNGNCHEGVGIPPSIEEPYDAEQFANGIDTQLERAVTYIRTGK